jgi:hypothetical protein
MSDVLEINYIRKWFNSFNQSGDVMHATVSWWCSAQHAGINVTLSHRSRSSIALKSSRSTSVAMIMAFDENAANAKVRYTSHQKWRQLWATVWRISKCRNEQLTAPLRTRIESVEHLEFITKCNINNRHRYKDTSTVFDQMWNMSHRPTYNTYCCYLEA